MKTQIKQKMKLIEYSIYHKNLSWTQLKVPNFMRDLKHT